ncbi:MAG: zinc transporter ZntB [Pseudomonadota bacterium]
MTTIEENSAAASPCDGDEPSPECPALVCAYGVKKTVGTPLSWDEVKSGARAGEFDWIWVHLHTVSADAALWVRAQEFIPAAAADALLAGETRPRMIQFDGGLAVNLRGVNHNPGAEPEDMVALRIWADAKHVVTSRRRLVKAIADVREIIEKPNFGPKTPGEFVALLASKMTNAIEPYVEEIADSIDELEDLVLEDGGRNVRKRLGEARRMAVQLRRYIAPQRDAIGALATSDIKLFDSRTRMALRETADVVTRMTEEIDSARERAMILNEQIMGERSDEMNRNMLILSTAAAVFLPLNFIAGLLGVNVAGIPGADSPLAFWIVVAATVSIGAAMIGFFRSRGWL